MHTWIYNRARRGARDSFFSSGEVYIIEAIFGLKSTDVPFFTYQVMIDRSLFN